MQNENLICSNWDFNRIQCSNWTAFSGTKCKRGLFLSFSILFVILWWYYVSLSTKMKVFLCLVWRHDVITSVHIRRHHRYIISTQETSRGKIAFRQKYSDFWLLLTYYYKLVISIHQVFGLWRLPQSSTFSRNSLESSSIRFNINNHRYKHPSSQALQLSVSPQSKRIKCHVSKYS